MESERRAHSRLNAHVLFALIFIASVSRPGSWPDINRYMGMGVGLWVALLFIHDFSFYYRRGDIPRRLRVPAWFLAGFFGAFTASMLLNGSVYPSFRSFVFFPGATLFLAALLPMAWFVFRHRFSPQSFHMGVGTLILVHLLALGEYFDCSFFFPFIQGTVAVQAAKSGYVNGILRSHTVYGAFSALSLVWSVIQFMDEDGDVADLTEGEQFFLKLLCGSLAILSAIGGILSTSRNFLWAAFVGLTVIIWHRGRGHRNVIALCIALIFTGLHLYSYLNPMAGKRFGKVMPYLEKLRHPSHIHLGDFVPRLDNKATTGRLRLWRKAMALIRKRPWLGHGPGSFRLISGEGWQINAHDFYVQTLVEGGIVTFFFLCGFLLSVGASMRSTSLFPFFLATLAILVFDNFIDYSIPWNLTVAYLMAWPSIPTRQGAAG